jgi:hypothetical protein
MLALHVSAARAIGQISVHHANCIENQYFMPDPSGAIQGVRNLHALGGRRKTVAENGLFKRSATR